MFAPPQGGFCREGGGEDLCPHCMEQEGQARQPTRRHRGFFFTPDPPGKGSDLEEKQSCSPAGLSLQLRINEER